MNFARFRRSAGVLPVMGLFVVLVGACSSSSGATPAASPATESAAPGGSAAAVDCPTSQPDPLPAGETRTVTISTEEGDITIQVSSDLSPIAVGNFVALAGCGFYDGTVFHRVVPKFVIQGGAREDGPGYTIQDEPVSTPYHRGTVAMARTSEPNSVDSQFFIVSDDSAAGALSSYNTYQIIGEVTAGMEAVDAITAAADAEIPTNPVVMTNVTVTSP